MQALWMVLAAFVFATMSVCIKMASAYFNSAEVVFYRGLIGVIAMWWLARSQGVALATRYPGMHAWRSAIGVSAMGAWFYAIAHLPLPTAITLNYMSSVWIAAFYVGGAMLAWRPSAQTPLPALQGSLVLAVMAGFAGVVMMLRPTLGQDQLFAGIVGLLSGIAAAFAYMQVVALSRMQEPETRTVFYFAVGSTVAGGGAMMLIGTSPWPGLPGLWLLPIGLLATVGQLCMTKAYASARTRKETLVVASLQYSGIVFGSIYSVLLFGDVPDLLGWLGMALIIASGVGATVLRGKSTKDSANKEPAQQD